MTPSGFNGTVYAEPPIKGTPIIKEMLYLVYLYFLQRTSIHSPESCHASQQNL